MGMGMGLSLCGFLFLTPFLGMCTIVHMGARPAASGLYIGP